MYYESGVKISILTILILNIQLLTFYFLDSKISLFIHIYYCTFSKKFKKIDVQNYFDIRLHLLESANFF